MTAIRSYTEHLPCATIIAGSWCHRCDRETTSRDTRTVEAEHGFTHVPCGRTIRDMRAGRLWCTGPGCARPVQPFELVARDLLHPWPVAR